MIDEQRHFTQWRKLKTRKRFSDHNAIKFQLDFGFKKLNNFPKRRKVWNFDNPQNWNRFKTSNDSTLQGILPDSGSVERRYKYWSSRLNSFLHKCFLKKRLIPNRQIYTNEIRRYISERKEIKKKLSRSYGIDETGQQYLPYNITIITKNDLILNSPQDQRLGKIIDDKISDFNHQVIREKVSEDGTIRKQDFWKIKEKIAPESSEMMHSLTDPAGNEIAEPLNIKHEYFREFQNRLMKRDIRPELQDYERIQNKVCYTRIRESEKVTSPDFTFDEIKRAVQELKGGQCNDPTGLIHEVFKNLGDGPFLQWLIPLKAQSVPSELE